MNTQNVKTAASESNSRWYGEGHNIKGISSSMAGQLVYLSTMREERMLERERAELLHGLLENIAKEICSTVTDWSTPRPVMPLSSVQAWASARGMALALYGEWGKAACEYAVDHLKTQLRAGYAMWRADIA